MWNEGSSLPKDACIFERDLHVVMARYQSRRVVLLGPGCLHRRTIDKAVRWAGQGLTALHFFLNRGTTRDTIGI
jgi:hypothetical protein